MLLITRPQPDATQLAEKLCTLGHQSVVAPLFEIIYNDDRQIDLANIGGLIFTSRNGVRALLRHNNIEAHIEAHKNLPIFAIGAATAALAKAAGWHTIYEAGGDVAALVALIVEKISASAATAPLLHIAGQHRAGDVQAALRAHNIQVKRAVLYRAQALAWPPRIIALLQAEQIAGILLYSQRAAHQFFTLFNALAAPPALPVFYCLSPAIAAIVVAAGGRAKIAPQPQTQALLALLEKP